MFDETKPYRDNFIPVIPVEYSYHTKENPFCWDETCPCHTDKEAISQVQQQYADGLLSAEEAIETIKGKMV